MPLLLRSAIEGVYTGLSYVGFLALAGLSARDPAVLWSAAAVAVLLGTGFYLRARRANRQP